MYTSSTTRTTQKILEVVRKRGLTGGVDDIVAAARKHTSFRIQERYVDRDAIAKAILEGQRDAETKKVESKKTTVEPQTEEKAPITLRPKEQVYLQVYLDRCQEIIYAMLETFEKGSVPPKEWVQELDETITKLREK